MNIEIFTICDFAADYRGKLCITGVFDKVWATKAPIKIRHVSIVFRFRVDAHSPKPSFASLTLIDADGRPILPEIKQPIAPPDDGTKRLLGNLIFNVVNFEFPAFGDYSLILTVDGSKTAELPLSVIKIQPKPKP